VIEVSSLTEEDDEEEDIDFENRILTYQPIKEASDAEEVLSHLSVQMFKDKAHSLA
jgi:hypothetical protein